LSEQNAGAAAAVVRARNRSLGEGACLRRTFALEFRLLLHHAELLLNPIDIRVPLSI
jgi:hypothetical protein